MLPWLACLQPRLASPTVHYLYMVVNNSRLIMNCIWRGAHLSVADDAFAWSLSGIDRVLCTEDVLMAFGIVAMLFLSASIGVSERLLAVRALTSGILLLEVPFESKSSRRAGGIFVAIPLAALSAGC